MVEVTVPAFIAKWSASRRTERAAAQEHFIDLCRLLGEQTPNEADPTGEDYAFEKGATKTSGGQGWADVWKRGRFAWEYKGKHANLRAAYQQLLQYREGPRQPTAAGSCAISTGLRCIRTSRGRPSGSTPSAWPTWPRRWRPRGAPCRLWTCCGRYSASRSGCVQSGRPNTSPSKPRRSSPRWPRACGSGA